MPLDSIPSSRITEANEAPLNPAGDFVLYWMIAFRRRRYNFSLQRAVEWAHEMKKPLLVLEALRCDYPWASERTHAFILQGMEDNRQAFEGSPALYFPYVEPYVGAGKGLLADLSRNAALVVTDDYPCFFLPRMVKSAAKRVPVRMEAVDSNGLLPIRAAHKEYSSAFSFRRFLKKNIADHLVSFPRKDPLAGISLPAISNLPAYIGDRWKTESVKMPADWMDKLSEFPIDHSVREAPIRGGYRSAKDRLCGFLGKQLDQYGILRHHPDEDATSGLSPYLHFGHISAHEIFAEVVEKEEWSPDRLGFKASGKRSDWWGMSEGAEAFLDQLITWRELGFNMCSRRNDYETLECLPDWAKKDLEAHAMDRRPYLYSRDAFDSAATHDPVWNAAERQLVEEGRIHGYLRMLWGKKILEWSPSPDEALSTMIDLNNRYGLDGRDPNSYTGILWVFGRYDRPWFPERPVYGRIRYMSSKSAIRKLRMQEYMQKFGSHD